MTTESRKIVVSNRLPLTIKKTEEGYTFKVSDGGLVSGLQGAKKYGDFIWIGWLGFEIRKEEQKGLTDTLVNKYKCVPVFLEQRLFDLYYTHYSNEVLWPVLHYFLDKCKYRKEYWEAYVEANMLMAEKLVEYLKKGDILWIHDYHLMMLPHFIKVMINFDIKIGFSLHSAFPSPDIFSGIPECKEILSSLLKCDLLSFHTDLYTKNFRNSCKTILGKEPTTKILANSLGIDVNKFHKALDDEKTKKFRDELSEKYKNKKVVISVDRVDYIKGINYRLKSINLFYEKNPKAIDYVVFVQIAVPSRENNIEYMNYANDLKTTVKEINEKYKRTVIEFIYSSVEFPFMVALFAISSACVISSLRDGMNLVCLEYIASQRDNNGVLVLSQFSGASDILPEACMRINPMDLDGVVESYQKALKLPLEKRKEIQNKLFQFINENTSCEWAKKFYEVLTIKTKLAAG